MKAINTITKKDAIEFAMVKKIDKRTAMGKAILNFFTPEEIEEFKTTAIAKRYARMYTTEAEPYQPIVEIKWLVESNRNAGSHTKIIIEGNNNLYLASPWYRHNDYNKAVFAPNTEANRKRAALINAMILR